MNRPLKIFLMCFSVVLLVAGCGKKGDEPVDVAGKKAEPSIIVDNAISADGVSITYEVRGEGEPALIFIHGWCCDRSYWKEQLPHFAEKYKVVAVDLAGHGESGLERKEWTMTAFGEDVIAVIDKLNLEQVVLVGHSMGGLVILATAKLIPEHVLGLIEVDEIFDVKVQHTQKQIEEFLIPLRTDFVKTFHGIVPQFFFTPKSNPDLVEGVISDMSECPPEIGVGIMSVEGGYFDFINNDLLSALKSLKIAIVCINSDSEPTPVESNQEVVPTMSAKIMPGVGHFVMMEAPETFNRLLEDTIQEFVQMTESK
ncbi:MAG: alpha/beta hydrolase [Candidatus Aminicenantes bacterium]|nr:alpha/beta hydrolase [Candidatus Aminicenantes bacterium]